MQHGSSKINMLVWLKNLSNAEMINERAAKRANGQGNVCT